MKCLTTAANKPGTGIVDVVKEVSRATGLTDESGQRRILQWLIDFGLQRRPRGHRSWWPCGVAVRNRAYVPAGLRNGVWSVPGAPPMRVANEDESEPVDYAQEWLGALAVLGMGTLLGIAWALARRPCVWSVLPPTRRRT